MFFRRLDISYGQHVIEIIHRYQMYVKERVKENRNARGLRCSSSGSSGRLPDPTRFPRSGLLVAAGDGYDKCGVQDACRVCYYYYYHHYRSFSWVKY